MDTTDDTIFEHGTNSPRKPASGHLYRQHFKLNASHNEDNTIRSIAAMLGVSEEKLRAEIKKGQENNREEYLAVQNYTESYRSLLDSTPKTTKDKYEELMDAGRFLTKTGLNIEFSAPSKMSIYPDFIFKMGEDKIGLEHSRIIDEKMKRATKTTQKLLQDAAVIVQQSDPSLDGIVNLFIDFDQPAIANKSLNARGFTTGERESLKKIVAKYVIGVLKKENPVSPLFITETNFESNPGHPVSIELGERYFAIGGFRELAEERIAAKDKRFNDYQSESGLKRIWLLLTVDGFSSHSGFDLENEIFIYDKHSAFELIVVFEVFSGKYFLIYDNNRHESVGHQ
ncbi:hypothetical protein [Mucilaginibacter sp. OK098]|uniref:hypothetical protein n=1 Tax=Mucilaginibacter sp. OK098 TaxID=1855297 RepID=UPI000917279E|nr:hypothetical protein [Mucilaginibacter sp. OK098]SHN26043.1 hypothetical protein SAMN05216524_107365 [Mucilaginibacter sp. OK098]